MALTDRMMGAAQLNVGTYEEVEHDLDATSQALTVVLIVALAQGIGGLIAELARGRPGAGVGALIFGLVVAVVGWLVWSFITYWVGTSLFGGTATWGELLRTIGFAQTPGILGFFRFIPILGPLVAFIGAIWMLVAGIIAIRQALDFSTGKAIATAIIGFIAYLIVAAIIGVFFGLLGFGASLLF